MKRFFTKLGKSISSRRRSRDKNPPPTSITISAPYEHRPGTPPADPPAYTPGTNPPPYSPSDPPPQYISHQNNQQRLRRSRNRDELATIQQPPAQSTSTTYAVSPHSQRMNTLAAQVAQMEREADMPAYLLEQEREILRGAMRFYMDTGYEAYTAYTLYGIYPTSLELERDRRDPASDGASMALETHMNYHEYVADPYGIYTRERAREHWVPNSHGVLNQHEHSLMNSLTQPELGSRSTQNNSNNEQVGDPHARALTDIEGPTTLFTPLTLPSDNDPLNLSPMVSSLPRDMGAFWGMTLERRVEETLYGSYAVYEEDEEPTTAGYDGEPDQEANRIMDEIIVSA